MLLTKSIGTHNKSSCYLLDPDWHKNLHLFAVSILSVLIWGCSRQPVSLQEQVAKYWEARIAGAVEQAYELEVPESLDKLTYQKKLLKSPIIFKTYTIQSIKENGDEAEVELRMEYILPGLSRTASSSMSDKWVKIHGRWYHELPTGDSGMTKEERG